jgi:hypothetical protein
MPPAGYPAYFVAGQAFFLDKKACPECSEGSQKIKAQLKFAPAPFYGVSSLKNSGKTKTRPAVAWLRQFVFLI